MKDSDDREFIRPFPRPFLMDALQYLTTFKPSAAQQKAIVMLNLKFLKNCAQEELNLINGVMAELENLEGG